MIYENILHWGSHDHRGLSVRGKILYFFNIVNSQSLHFDVAKWAKPIYFVLHTFLFINFSVLHHIVRSICTDSVPRSKGQGFLTVSSHILSRFSFLLLVTVHLPPLAHSGSSHLGSTPALNKWKSAFAGNLLGLNIWSYKLQRNHHITLQVIANWKIFCKWQNYHRFHL